MVKAAATQDKQASTSTLKKSNTLSKTKIVHSDSKFEVQDYAQPVVATLSQINTEGLAFIQYAEKNATKILARSIISLNEQMIGCSVLVLFENGDPALPIITGQIQPPVSTYKQVAAEADGKRLIFSAENEVMLKCGDASITLTKQGKVLIQGAYVLSRSTGSNKIKGASVEIN